MKEETLQDFVLRIAKKMALLPPDGIQMRCIALRHEYKEVRRRKLEHGGSKSMLP